LWGAFAVKRCLRGYVRFGCCQCVLPCPPLVWTDMGQYCKKPAGYKTHLYHSYQQCAKSNYIDPAVCESYSVSQFTEKCDPGYSRTGAIGCIMDCPPGWPDEGSFCEKLGTSAGSYPFPWMPGDGKAERVLVKKVKGKKGKKGKKSKKSKKKAKKAKK